MNLSRSLYYYASQKDDTIVIEKLKQLAEKHISEGQGKYYRRIRGEDIPWNHKRIERVYRMLGLNKRRPKRKRLPARVKEPLNVPQRPNDTWSMDFMHDSLTNGRKFRVINIIDDYNREALRIEPYFSIGSKMVVKELSRLVLERGKPSCIRVDNGPEFIAEIMQQWCRDNEIKLHFIQPGKPTQNAYIERFNRSFRSEVLDAYYFDDLNQVRILCEIFMNDYNEHRPHESLGHLSPKQYHQNILANGFS
jgi:putative transposase